MNIYLKGENKSQQILPKAWKSNLKICYSITVVPIFPLCPPPPNPPLIPTVYLYAIVHVRGSFICALYLAPSPSSHHSLSPL